MLAKPTKGVTEILDRFQTIAFTAEWKYDGERAQVTKGWASKYQGELMERTCEPE